MQPFLYPPRIHLLVAIAVVACACFAPDAAAADSDSPARRYGPQVRPVELVGADYPLNPAPAATGQSPSATGKLNFRANAGAPTGGEAPATLVVLPGGISLNRAVANLANTAGLGFVPSPTMAETVVETTRIPQGSAVEMINALLGPYGYRALVRNQTVEVYGKNIDAKLSSDVMYYQLKHVHFIDMPANSRELNTTVAAGGGGQGSAQAGQRSGGGSSGQSGTESGNLAASSVQAFFKRIGATMLTEQGSIEYDPRSRTVIARDLPPYLEMLRQYLDNFDRPQKMVVTHLRILSVSYNPERNQGIDWNGFTDAVTATVRQTGGNSASVAAAAGGVLNSVTGGLITFPGGNSPGRNNLALTLPELTATLNLMRQYADVDLLQESWLVSHDGMAATSFFGRQLFIVVPGTSATGAGTASAPQTFQPEVGDAITVVPEVGANNMVSMAFKLDTSREDANRQFGGNSYPQFAKRSAQQFLQAADGQTVLLSGYLSDQVTVNRSGLPLLGDIPILGPRVFGNTKSIRARQSVVFLFTPRVVNADDVAGMAAATGDVIERAKIDKDKANGYVWPETTLRESVSGLAVNRPNNFKAADAAGGIAPPPDRLPQGELIRVPPVSAAGDSPTKDVLQPGAAEEAPSLLRKG
jgi:hypothetical protein